MAIEPAGRLGAGRADDRTDATPPPPPQNPSESPITSLMAPSRGSGSPIICAPVVVKGGVERKEVLEMGAVTRKQIEELAARNEEAGWFDSVCAEIANGASVDEAYAKLLENYDVSWGAFRTWVKANDERERKYQDALAARVEYRRERVAANVTEIASVAHREVKPSDTLRAAEIVLDSGVREGNGAAVSITIVHESA